MSRFWFCFLLPLLACGDAMVDGSYEGEPYLRVDGVFRGSVGEEIIHAPRLGIMWATHDGRYEILGLDTRLTSIRADPLSSHFSFEVWDLPPASALVSACGARLAVGALAVYDDVNGDGKIELATHEESLRVVDPDKALGLGVFYYLLYADAPLVDCDSPLGPLPSLPPGFHVIVLHACEAWEVASPFVEVRLFPPADSFPFLPSEEPTCSPEG